MSLLDDINAATNAYAIAVAAGGVVEPDGVPAVIVTPPDGDLGYGIDLSCTDDLTANMAEIDPNSPAAVEEAIYRRITTPHGTLKYLGEDPDYGRDVTAFLSTATTAVDIQAQQDLLAAECLKDDRVASCTCTITQMGTDTFSVSITGLLQSGQTYNLVETFATGAQLIEDMNA